MNKSNSRAIAPEKWTRSLLQGLLIISPTFLLVLPGWMTRILPAIAILSVLILFRIKKYHLVESLNKDKWLLIIPAALMAPFIAVFLGELFRQKFIWNSYDSPAHILICIPVFWAIIQLKTNCVRQLSFAFPAAALIALISILVDPNLFYGHNRLTTYALDPLAFGSLSLTFGLLSLISIELHEKKLTWQVLYKLSGFAAGIYLSIASGSRTGWMSLPIVLILWLCLKYTPKNKRRNAVAAIMMIAGVTLTYQLSSSVRDRVDIAWSETSNYQWNATNHETSVGARISFMRIAIFLFQKNPIAGWGDAGFSSVIDDPALHFAEMHTRELALDAGFHNEILASTVRSGIWGLLTSLALFLVPAWLFIKNLRAPLEETRHIALLALTFLICQFIASMSMELLNLRYSASFYGLMIAIFCSSVLVSGTNNKANTKL